jgi:predicted transposase/invertase (TIGR01784 family)
MDHAPSQHDHFFRALMERPKAAGALLRERLPPPIAEQLVGDPVLVEGTFVDEEMRKSQSDRLFQVALRGGRSAFIYCLVEHKSAPDPRVALQLLRYLVRIWERLDRQAEGKGLLPPILPLVVYHGEPQWNTPTRFSSLLAATEEMRPHLLDFPFGLLDVGEVEDEKLSSEMELRAGLIVLKYASRVSEENVEEVVTWVLTWLHGVPKELFLLALRYMLRGYRLRAHRLSWERFESASRRVMNESEQEMIGSVASELLAEGRLQGEARGQAKALLLVLERRFGPLPGELLKRVGDAKAAQLETWLGRAVDGATLDEVLSEPSKH